MAAPSLFLHAVGGRLTRLVPVMLLSGCIVVPIPIPVPTSADTRAVPLVWSNQRDPGKAPASSRCPAPAEEAAARDRVVALTNAARRESGLAPLQPSQRLDRVAHGHACDMAARGTFSHAGSDGSDLGLRMRRGNYAYRMGAENVAKGFDTPERLVSGWMNSPGHRANILQPKAREVGVGLARPAGDRPYWVMVLGAPR